MSFAMFPDLVVNGEAVPQGTVAAETQNHTAPEGKPGIAWRKAARAVAVRTLMLQEARRRGIAPQPAEVGPGRFETEEEAVIRGLLDEAVMVEPPAEAAIHDEWARDPSRFRSPPLWEVSHILIACDLADAETSAAVQARARDLAAELARDPRSFASLAAEHSDCGSKSAGGSLGQLRPGDTVPEFEAALRDLPEGGVTTEPVLTRQGCHVIRMDAVSDGAVLPYAAVRGAIRDAMEKAAWARQARAFTEDLVSRAEISGADFHPIQGGAR